MCENASWYEKDKQVYFLTDADLDSKRGRELKKHLGNQFDEDKVGHGAIAFFYEVDYNFGIKKECTDFSTPDNFPVELITAIKKGKRTQFGVMPDILTPEARENYLKIQQSAYENYLKIEQLALENYNKIQQPAWEKYLKIEQSTWENYLKIRQSAWENYQKIRKSAWKNYTQTINSAFWEIALQKKNRKEAWR